MSSREYEGRFDIDTEGFKTQMSEMEPYRLVQEIIANSFDEVSVKNIGCILDHDGKNLSVTVTDDGKGFRSIKDVFTLFRNSYKRKNVQQRGRFNLGEKEVMAVADSGYIRSRDWKVEFYGNKRKETKQLENNNGTTVFAKFDWEKNQIKNIINELEKLIVPKDKNLTINGMSVPKKTILRTVKARLWTEEEDPKSLRMVRKLNDCDIDIYEKKPEEDAWIFEMGVPVQPFLDKDKVIWHVDVQQKIPLTIKRDVISDKYLKDIYVLLVNKCHDLIDKESAGNKFVHRAMIEVDKEPAQDILKKQWGTEKVYIPSEVDTEANESVGKVGGAFLPKGLLDRDERSHLREIGVVKFATDDFGSGLSKEYKTIPLTEQMKKYIKIVKRVAKDVIKKDINVQVCDSDSTHPAWYGMNTLTYNIRYLPKKKNFFNEFTEYGIGLLVHELSHDKVPAQQEIPMPHASGAFLNEMERISGAIGAKGFDYWINKGGD